MNISGLIKPLGSARGMLSKTSTTANIDSSVAVPALVIYRDIIYYSTFSIEVIDKEIKLEISVNAVKSSDLNIYIASLVRINITYDSGT
jgi:hypothetical protein